MVAHAEPAPLDGSYKGPVCTTLPEPAERSAFGYRNPYEGKRAYEITEAKKKAEYSFLAAICRNQGRSKQRRDEAAAE